MNYGLILINLNLVANDEHFFFGGSQDEQSDYDYDDTALLIEAIAAGARGAYRDILGRVPQCSRG